MARYGRKLEELRGLVQQLAAIDALGSEQQREQLQALVDQVMVVKHTLQLTVLAIITGVAYPTCHHGNRSVLNWLLAMKE